MIFLFILYSYFAINIINVMYAISFWLHAIFLQITMNNVSAIDDVV